MTDQTPPAVREAAADHPAFEPANGGYDVETTVFDARLSATAAGEGTTHFVATVAVPTLDAAVDGAVGEAVAAGWLETLERRLADAPAATRERVDPTLDVEREDGTVTVTYGFGFDDAERGLAVAKTLVEYVEGTYVEGVVPGYDYRPPVADLLSEASQGDGDRGGTPL